MSLGLPVLLSAFHLLVISMSSPHVVQVKIMHPVLLHIVPFEDIHFSLFYFLSFFLFPSPVYGHLPLFSSPLRKEIVLAGTSSVFKKSSTSLRSRSVLIRSIAIRISTITHVFEVLTWYSAAAVVQKNTCKESWSNISVE